MVTDEDFSRIEVIFGYGEYFELAAQVVFAAPSGHLVEDGVEVAAFGGEGVFGAGRDFSVAGASDDAVGFEVVEALAEGTGVDGAVQGAGVAAGIADVGRAAHGIACGDAICAGAGVACAGGATGADGALQLAETLGAFEEVAEDEGGPFVADDGHGGGDAAGFGLHGSG